MLDLLTWFRRNMCDVELRDNRNYRVRFLDTDFIHLIKLVNKFGKEPKNALHAIEDIKRGRIQFHAGRFDPQRAAELSWAKSLA